MEAALGGYPERGGLSVMRKRFFIPILFALVLIPSLAAAGLVSEWKLDGNGTDTQSVMDLLAVGGAQFIASGGISGGYGYVPDGSAWFRVPDTEMHQYSTNFTVEFWFRQRADQSFQQDLIYKGSSLSYSMFWVFRQLYDGVTNFGPVIAGCGDGEVWNQVSNPNQLSHGTWHHVAYVVGSTEHAYYLDGQLVDSSALGYGAGTPALDIIIGDSAVDTDFDEIRFFNHARTQPEIEAYYRSLTPPVWNAGFPAVDVVDVYQFSFKMQIDEGGKAYYVLLLNGATPPTAAEVKAGVGSGGAAPELSGSADLAANATRTVTLTGLNPSTSYDLYVVAEDTEATPNLQDDPVQLGAITGAELTVDVVIAPGATSADYVAVSVPLQPQDSTPQAVLEPWVGAYDTTNFRIGRWLAALAGYQEYPDMADMLPGHTYWFLARNGLNLTFTGAPAPEVNNPYSQASVSVFLDEGWNQVGNPYPEAIEVADIVVYDDATESAEYLTTGPGTIAQNIFWVYNGVTYVAAVQLPVAGGGWVKKLTPGTGKIFFSRSGTGADLPQGEYAPDMVRAVPDDVERPPSPPGMDISDSSAEGGGGGGGGGGCFIRSSGD